MNYYDYLIFYNFIINFIKLYYFSASTIRMAIFNDRVLLLEKTDYN